MVLEVKEELEKEIEEQVARVISELTMIRKPELLVLSTRLYRKIESSMKLLVKNLSQIETEDWECRRVKRGGCVVHHLDLCNLIKGLEPHDLFTE